MLAWPGVQQRLSDPDGYFEGAPRLAIEVISKANTGNPAGACP